jgi:hypothetical protein
MEVTPQQIDAARTQAEIDRRLKQSLASLPHDATEQRALETHPPVFRTTRPVPTALRNPTVEPEGRAALPRRQPKIKKHVLP